MNQNNILDKIKENIDLVISKDTPLGSSLWRELLAIHPVDIVDFLEELDTENAKKLFVNLPRNIRNEIFIEFSEPAKSEYLSDLDELEKVELLNALSIDDLSDFFDYISDEDLKKYLNLIHRKEREKVISLMKFHPESAGGIMDIEILSLLQDFSVEKSINLLQRMQPRQELHREIYVTDQKNKLVGHIRIEDLVLRSPKSRISEFLRRNELVAQADEDQEGIAKKMVHYGLMTVPVIGIENYFLGVIPSDTLVDIIVEEASEDAQKMAALTPIKQTYFETPIYKFLWQRSYILVILLMAESLSTSVLSSYEKTLPPYLVFFITMLMSTGGNTSHQTSTLVVRGLTSGEVHRKNIFRFLKREVVIALLLALVLGISAFLRAFYTITHVQDSALKVVSPFKDSFVVGLTLGLIVLTAAVLGSFIPIALDRIKIDPAFSAGPSLATLMDILGVTIYCLLIKFLLF